MSEPSSLVELIAAVSTLQVANADVVEAAQAVIGAASAPITPHALGSLSISATIPIDEYRSIEALVVADTEVALPPGALGNRSTVLLTNPTAEPVTVTLPTLNWISPIGGVWGGVIASGRSVRISFVRSSLGWEAIEASLSTTALAQLIPGASVTLNPAIMGSANVQAALAALAATLESISGDVQGNTEPLGSISGAVALPTALHRSITGTVTGDVTFSLAQPITPRTVVARLKQDGVGGRNITITPPVNGIHYIGGALPTYPSSANAEFIITLRFDGVDWPWVVGVDSVGAPS